MFILFSVALGSEMTIAKLSPGLIVEDKKPPQRIGAKTTKERRRLERTWIGCENFLFIFFSFLLDFSLEALSQSKLKKVNASVMKPWDTAMETKMLKLKLLSLLALYLYSG